MTDFLERISIDPDICGGKPCIKGTRIWVTLILDFLTSGMMEAELLAEYPQLEREDILAAIAYCAELSRGGADFKFKQLTLARLVMRERQAALKKLAK
jgi:uncharacterized protein (DUF433 family)